MIKIILSVWRNDQTNQKISDHIDQSDLNDENYEFDHILLIKQSSWSRWSYIDDKIYKLEDNLIVLLKIGPWIMKNEKMLVRKKFGQNKFWSE